MVSAKRADFDKISRECGISPILARLIRNRDVIGVEETRRFLSGSLSDLSDPRLLPDGEKAVDILTEKIREGKKIRIIGDYDVDGICSSYILLFGLQRCGAQADAVLPERLRDGYGVNERLIREAAADGADTIMTCDNGIAAAEPLAKAAAAGMTVIVTDHHEVPFKLTEDGDRRYLLPPADAVADPKIPGSLTGGRSCPFPEICGAVVAYKICLLLAEKVFGGREKAEYTEIEEYLLPFAALATVCDVMPLKNENRIIVREGLRLAQNCPNPGLQALLKVTGLSGAALTCYHAGFVIGPCLNAAGRLDSAYRGLELFTEKDPDKALITAQQLKDLNDSRKSMTMEGTDAAEAMIVRLGIDCNQYVCQYALDMSLERIQAMGAIYEKAIVDGELLTDDDWVPYDYSAIPASEEGFYLEYRPAQIDSIDAGGRYGLQFFVNSRGIVFAHLRNQFNRGERIGTPEKLITHEEAISRFHEEINRSRYGSDEQTIYIRWAVLTYEPVRASGNGNGMVFVPTWAIMYQDQKASLQEFEQYALFNAIDGTLIDASFR